MTMRLYQRPKPVFQYLILVFFLGLSPILLKAQNTLKGRVLEYGTKAPIPYASIFLTNTTLGVTADEEGKFSLKIPDGSFDVIVRMLGYESVNFSINTNELPASGYQVQLNTMDQELEEIELEVERDPIWYRNLEYFKWYFIGSSKNGREVVIENEKKLLLDRDTNPNILQVSAKEPIILDNPNLGYKVEFLLVDFQYNFKEETILYKGYPLFIPYKDLGKSKQKKIAKNRAEAYNGSLQHFIHSLYLGISQDEGFVVRRLKKIPNPEKPTKTEMDEARLIFKASSSLEVKDSIQTHFLSKAHLSDEIEILDQNELDPEILLDRHENGRVFIQFEDQIHITYLNETLPREYVGASAGRDKKSPQISRLRITDPKVEIFFSGSFDDPLGIMVEEYMAWERVGDLMPWDYVPIRGK